MNDYISHSIYIHIYIYPLYIYNDIIYLIAVLYNLLIVLMYFEDFQDDKLKSQKIEVNDDYPIVFH